MTTALFSFNTPVRAACDKSDGLTTSTLFASEQVNFSMNLIIVPLQPILESETNPCIVKMQALWPVIQHARVNKKPGLGFPAFTTSGFSFFMIVIILRNAIKSLKGVSAREKSMV